MPEHTHNQWAHQWNRYACTVSDCTVFRTLEMGIEYDDPTGHLDPYEIEAAYIEQTQAPVSKKSKRAKIADPNVEGETQDELVAVLGEGNDNGTVQG